MEKIIKESSDDNQIKEKKQKPATRAKEERQDGAKGF